MMLLLLFLNIETESSATGSFDWKTLIFIGGVIILAFTMPRLIRRTTNERQQFIKQCNREIDGQTEIRNQIDKIMVELVEAGQEINAQLDTKMRVLNHLIRDAEAIADRIDQQIAKLEKHSPQITENESNTAFMARGPQNRPALTPENISQPANTDSGRWRNDLRSRIEKYHHEHRTPAEIARLLHLSLSEVNLVIDMCEAQAKK